LQLAVRCGRSAKPVVDVLHVATHPGVAEGTGPSMPGAVHPASHAADVCSAGGMTWSVRSVTMHWLNGVQGVAPVRCDIVRRGIGVSRGVLLCLG